MLYIDICIYTLLLSRESNLFEFRITWLYLDNEVLVPDISLQPLVVLKAGYVCKQGLPDATCSVSDAGRHSIAYRIYLPFAARLMIDRWSKLLSF